MLVCYGEFEEIGLLIDSHATSPNGRRALALDPLIPAYTLPCRRRSIASCLLASMKLF
jgi:hypothetical protein